MKKVKPMPVQWTEAPRISPIVSRRASEIIRLAEGSAAAGKFGLALEQLSRARQTDPNNKYIDALIERTRELQRKQSGQNPETLPAPAIQDEARYLTVTVGHEFEEGIKPAAPHPPTPKSDYRDIVHELTDIAREFLKLNLPEPAFDALMKAYMLDPLSPEVLQCEQSVLPAWNAVRSAKKADTSSGIPAPLLNVPPVRPADSPLPPALSDSAMNPVTKTDRAPQDESQRLEILMQQKELERQEKERAVWREASSMPRIFWDDLRQDSSSILPPDEEVSKPVRRFLGRLRRKH